MNAPTPNPRSTVKIAGHPLHPMLVQFPIAFFTGAFASDLASWRAGDSFFAAASAWLIGVGLIMATLAALAGLTDAVASPEIRALRAVWLHMAANVLAVVLEVVNLALRLNDAEGAVVPIGLCLSAAVTLLLLFSGWKGADLVFRHRVGVSDS